MLTHVMPTSTPLSTTPLGQVRFLRMYLLPTFAPSEAFNETHNLQLTTDDDC